MGFVVCLPRAFVVEKVGAHCVGAGLLLNVCYVPDPLVFCMLDSYFLRLWTNFMEFIVALSNRLDRSFLE